MEVGGDLATPMLELVSQHVGRVLTLMRRLRSRKWWPIIKAAGIKAEGS
jgi:hypothetical protein